MAISSLNLFVVFISFFVVFFPCPGLSLSPSLSHRCPSHESHALLRFKAGFNSSEYSLTSWVNGTDCCSWVGISCDNHTNHVVSVSIDYLNGFFNGLMSESFCQLRFLKSLVIQGFTGTKILSACLGNLSYMEFLSLDNYDNANALGGPIPSFLCLLTQLKELDLFVNMLNGSIPSCLGNLSSLVYLDLAYNQLSGSIPTCLCNLPSLTSLNLTANQFSGSIPPCLANLSSLYYLGLSYNQLSGSIPTSFAQLSFLDYFYGDGNHFNETILSSSLPSSLVYLSLSLNGQSVPETFFQNLTKLRSLYLSDCVLNISKSWIPPFQLYKLQLESSMIDDEIPPWISTQFLLYTLKLVNSSLVGQIPSWLWETNSMLESLDLSINHLEGRLFSNTLVWMSLEILDVSRNKLKGNIPSVWSPNMTVLMLNDNFFSGNIPPSLGKLSRLEMLNLANNNFTGVIPTTLSTCSSLHILNLGNNSLDEGLPHEFSNLSELYSLVVHSNNLKGSLPSSIAYCSALQVLDIGNNLFGGKIPTSLKNLSNLRVLVMKENNFIGQIPLELGQLMNLQILLLSSNHISGSIPHTIISLQAMSIESQNGYALSTYADNVLYYDGLDMTLKGTYQHYPYILSTLTCIDLSNNELEGEIAYNFGKLKGLRLLNLSMNNLNGTIPKSLGEISQLESLDLSINCFSGEIPIELESLSYLGSLDLSNNNLSGSIPQGKHITSTFGESSFSGNPNLWGCPLPKKCPWPQFDAPPPTPSSLVNKEKKNFVYLWYKITIGLSYGASFGGIISLLSMMRMSWRRKYFYKVDTILKFLFPWMKNLRL